MPHGAIPFPFGDCRICNDKATGFHYGVATCEGCKGFFKRSIPKGDKYTCFFGGNCTITPFNRNRCKACRFKRCLDNGMAIDAVKMGRIPKVEKERALLENRLQKRNDTRMDLEDENLGDMSDLYSWSDPSKSQERLASDRGHVGGHSSRIDAPKDLKQNDIPTAPPTLLHPLQRSYSCEGREMPRLIPEWKAGNDFKTLVCADSSYNGSTMHNHQMTENAFSFSSSDADLHQGFLGMEHPPANIGSTHRNAMDCPGKRLSAQGVGQAFQPLASVKKEPNCLSFNHEHKRDSVNWDLDGNSCEANFPSVSIGYPKFSANEDNLPALESQQSTASWKNSYLVDDLSKKQEYKIAPPHNLFISSSEKPASHKELSRNSLDVGVAAPRTMAPPRSSYSPDIIKVLLDQVGGEKIKGIKQHIMTTVANTFGPEEYEATKQLLSSYTEPTETDTVERSYSLHVPYSNAPLSPGPPHVTANGLSTFSATVPHKTPLGQEGVLPSLNGTYGADQHHSSWWFDKANGRDMTAPDTEERKPFTACSKRGPCFLSRADIMETDNGLDMCVPGELDDQMFNDQYDTVMDLRSSDKASGSNSQNSGSDKDSTSPDSRGLDELSMSESSQTLLTSFETHMSVLLSKYDKLKHFIKNKSSLPTHPLTPEGKEVVYNLLITAIPSINKSIIGFCQDVPGFASLAKGDKEILVKRGYYDIWIMTNSRLFYDSESFLQLSDGTFYTRAWMERILNPVIVEKIISFTKKFNKLELSKLELAILCAIQLTASGHESLEFERAESIQQVNSYYVDLLVEEVSKRRPANCSRILLDLFRLLPDLRELNLLQREIIASLSTETCPDKVDYKTETGTLSNVKELDIFDQY